MAINKLLSAIVVCAAFGSVNAMADTSYQYEVAVAQETRDAGPFDIDTTRLFARYYFSPVSTATGPREEAGFLNRSANIFAQYHYSDLDWPGQADISSSFWQVGGVYTRKDSDFYLGGAIGHVNNSETDQYQLNIGWYAGQNWLVTADVEFFDNNDDDGFLFSEDQLNVGVSTKRLFDLGGETYLNLELGYLNLELPSGVNGSEHQQNIALDYYFNPALSVGLGYQWSGKDVLSDDESILSVNVNWYFNDTMALGLGYSHLAVDDNNQVDGDAFQIGLNMRF